jgi:hypothetical protein
MSGTKSVATTKMIERRQARKAWKLGSVTPAAVRAARSRGRTSWGSMRRRMARRTDSLRNEKKPSPGTLGGRAAAGA